MSLQLNIFRDQPKGKVSMTRAMFGAWGFGGLLVWLVVSFRSNMLQEIPTSVAALIGALGGFKAIQKFPEMAWKEKLPDDSSQPTQQSPTQRP